MLGQHDIPASAPVGAVPRRPASREERERWGGGVRVVLSLLWIGLGMLEPDLPAWMWIFLFGYIACGLLVLVAIWRGLLPRIRQGFILLMDVTLLTSAIHCVGASLTFLPVIYPMIVVGFSLMSGRLPGLLALLITLMAYGGLLFAESTGLLPPATLSGPASGHGPQAPLMAFAVIAGTSGGIFFLLAVSIKRIERYSEMERELVEAERLARVQSEKLSVQLEQAKRLEGIGRLAGGVAHEFNNLLTVILGYSRFVSDELPDDSPLRDDVREVVSSAERAATLTSQLLTFGRKQMFRKRLVDLSSLVSSHARRLVGQLPSNVTLEVSLPSGPIEALVDPSSIDAMLEGLVANALEAMPSGGRLRLSVSRSLIGAGDRVDTTGLWGECAAIEVTDTGAGMDEHVRTRLFEPFFTTKSPSEGRGMGLATIYGAARQHGGSVEAESVPGQGTTMRILLPTALETRHTLRSSVPSASAHPVPVLLVEDEELVRRVTARILRKAGFNVREAKDADEALALLEGEATDIELLVTDIVMPGRSGIELASLLHEKWPTLPVLFMSGYTDHSFDPDEKAGGPSRAFLAKPFSEDALLREIGTLLGSPVTSRENGPSPFDPN